MPDFSIRVTTMRMENIRSKNCTYCILAFGLVNKNSAYGILVTSTAMYLANCGKKYDGFDIYMWVWIKLWQLVRDKEVNMIGFFFCYGGRIESPEFIKEYGKMEKVNESIVEEPVG